MAWFFTNILFDLWNVGLTAGLTLGAMLILRPVLLKVTTAQQRAWLGMLGWYGNGMAPIFGFLGWIHLLPVTFRDLITPRTGISTYDVPAYLPERYQGAGEYAVALPGGRAVWVEFSNGMVLPLLHPDAAKIQAIANNKTYILFIWMPPFVSQFIHRCSDRRTVCPVHHQHDET